MSLWEQGRIFVAERITSIATGEMFERPREQVCRKTSGAMAEPGLVDSLWHCASVICFIFNRGVLLWWKYEEERNKGRQLQLSFMLYYYYYTTNRQVAGSIPDGVIGIFQWHNPSGRSMPWGRLNL
jgi:hypothetical protein